jgi:hypothetical protein
MTTMTRRGRPGLADVELLEDVLDLPFDRLGLRLSRSQMPLLDPNTLFTQGVAVSFKNGRVFSLGTLPGRTRSFAQDINDP